jgi:hypothetical protein
VQTLDQLFRSIRLIVLVVTEQTRLNAVVIEQPFGGAGVLAGDPSGFFQDADRPVSDVLKVADGSRDYVEAARNF